jgi:uncharacterized membrane protein
MNNLKSKFQEKIPRSLAKVITWRVLVTITNTVGGFLASGSWVVGLGVASFALVVNSILYFFHERAWNRSGWGKDIIDQEKINA